MLEREDTHAVGMRHDAVGKITEASVADLLYLSELNEPGPFLLAHTEQVRAAVSKELAAFSRLQGTYDQIRVLSLSGMELLRVDDRDGVPTVAPLEMLTTVRHAGPPRHVGRRIAGRRGAVR